MNVSRALGIYGVKTQALVLAGAHNRERYEEPLKEEGIQYTIIPVEGYTRENISIVEEDHTVTRFLLFCSVRGYHPAAGASFPGGSGADPGGHLRNAAQRHYR
jgi:hypothetical protein